MDQVTPREEFEEIFGKTDDHEWEWLKEFFLRNQVTGGGRGTLERDS